MNLSKNLLKNQAQHHLKNQSNLEKKKKIIDKKIDEDVEIMIRVAHVHGYPFLLTDHSLRGLRGLSNIVLSARIDFAAIVTPASNLSRQARLDLLTFILKLEP